MAHPNQSNNSNWLEYIWNWLKDLFTNIASKLHSFFNKPTQKQQKARDDIELVEPRPRAASAPNSLSSAATSPMQSPKAASTPPPPAPAPSALMALSWGAVVTGIFFVAGAAASRLGNNPEERKRPTRVKSTGNLVEKKPSLD